MSSCPMAYLGKAISTGGLSLPLPQLPLPGSLEGLIADDPELRVYNIDCPPVPEIDGERRCASFADASCGLTWCTFDEVESLDRPWFGLIAQLERAQPGAAEDLLGGFQNDFDDVAEAQVALVAYACITGQAELEAEARAALGDRSARMRQMADIAWQNDPESLASQRYESAIFDASAGLEVDPADLNELAVEDARVAALEALVEVGETAPAAIKSGEALKAEAEERTKTEGCWY